MNPKDRRLDDRSNDGCGFRDGVGLVVVAVVPAANDMSDDNACDDGAVVLSSTSSLLFSSSSSSLEDDNVKPNDRKLMDFCIAKVGLVVEEEVVGVGFCDMHEVVLILLDLSNNNRRDDLLAFAAKFCCLRMSEVFHSELALVDMELLVRCICCCLDVVVVRELGRRGPKSHSNSSDDWFAVLSREPNRYELS